MSERVVIADTMWWWGEVERGGKTEDVLLVKYITGWAAMGRRDSEMNTTCRS